MQSRTYNKFYKRNKNETRNQIYIGGFQKLWKKQLMKMNYHVLTMNTTANIPRSIAKDETSCATRRCLILILVN
jgi:hypothetical protein